MDLTTLFPDQDYRFQMGLRRGRIGDYFRSSPRGPAILSERKHWLDSDSDRYSAWPGSSHPLIRETIEIARAHHVCPVELALNSDLSVSDSASLLARNWEPDFLLLNRRTDGTFVLAGGAVCFPSHWSLPEKLGLGVEEIHGVVPGLNQDLGVAINRFLQKVTPGAAFERDNWGLAAAPDLNQHPTRHLPRLTSEVSLEKVWLRVEHQAFVALPATGGLLFVIRVLVFPLDKIKRDSPKAARGLARALAAMPEAVAAYKGLSAARAPLIELLQR